MYFFICIESKDCSNVKLKTIVKAETLIDKSKENVNNGKKKMTKTMRFKKKIIYREKYLKNRIINSYEIFYQITCISGRTLHYWPIHTRLVKKKKKCKSPKFLIIRTFVRMIVIFCFYYNHDTYTYTWIHEISRFAFSTMIQCIEFTMYYARSNIFDKLQFCWIIIKR